MMKNNLLSLAVLAFGLALTACGPSKATLAIIEKATLEEVESLDDKFTWLKYNAKSGGSYIIELDSDETIKGTILEYNNKRDITIIIKGIKTNRTISKSSTSIFGVGSGVTLILDNNITIKGLPYNPEYRNAPDGFLNNVTSYRQYGEIWKVQGVVQTEYRSLVYVLGGTLIMNDGSAITGNTCNKDKAGGVLVVRNGTFIMKGGNISGNACAPELDVHNEMKDGFKKVTYGWKPCGVGGVYVQSGTFTKTGGTIAGNAIKDHFGNVTKSSEIYFEGTKSIDTPIGPEMNLQFKNGKLTEGKSGKSKTLPSDENEDDEE